MLSCDRGLRSRGCFARARGQPGVVIRQAGVESPEQIGRVERHGVLWKSIMKFVITDHEALGFPDMRIAADVSTQDKSTVSRDGRYSPSLRLFGTQPRAPGDQVNEQEFADLSVARSI